MPVVVLSAGITQTIAQILDAHHLTGPHLSITANEILFDETGMYSGINPPGYIHIGNKDEQHGSSEAKNLRDSHPHVILLGDRVEDINMIQTDDRKNTIAI